MEEDILDRMNRLMAPLKYRHKRKEALRAHSTTGDSVKQSRMGQANRQNAMVLKSGKAGRELRLFEPGEKG